MFLVPLVGISSVGRMLKEILKTVIGCWFVFIGEMYTREVEERGTSQHVNGVGAS